MYLAIDYLSTILSGVIKSISYRCRHFMFKKIILTGLILIGCFLCAVLNRHVDTSCAHMTEQTAEQKIVQRLDTYMQALTGLNRFSGSVVVAKGNTVLLNKGYGLANHEFDVPNTPQTRFRICSITKMITATAIMQLQEKELLHVTDPISTYLPDYPRGNEITIHHLLTHTSGIFSGNLPFEMVVFPASLEQMVTFYKDKPFEYEPGSDYQYSNAGYFLLSCIIEKVSGKKYEAYVQKNILAPLEMHQSVFREHDYAILKQCASGYCFDATNRLVNGHYVYENFRGSGGLCCTAHDLYTFVFALNTGMLINEKSHKAMCTPYHMKEDYGYGCQIHQVLDHNVIEHGGMLSSGFKSNLSTFVDDDLYIIILSNSFSAWVNEARNALAAIMFDQPYDVPSCDVIKLDPDSYGDYVGTYDHPGFTVGYTIEQKGTMLSTADGIKLAPVAVDQFVAVNRDTKNILYTFMRSEKGDVVQLRIKGGAPYFEVRCAKKTNLNMASAMNPLQ
jgi:CubicO group peptidase (beta-lactamase class C family)